MHVAVRIGGADIYIYNVKRSFRVISAFRYCFIIDDYTGYQYLVIFCLQLQRSPRMRIPSSSTTTTATSSAAAIADWKMRGRWWWWRWLMRQPPPHLPSPQSIHLLIHSTSPASLQHPPSVPKVPPPPTHRWRFLLVPPMRELSTSYTRTRDHCFRWRRNMLQRSFPVWIKTSDDQKSQTEGRKIGERSLTKDYRRSEVRGRRSRRNSWKRWRRRFYTRRNQRGTSEKGWQRKRHLAWESYR